MENYTEANKIFDQGFNCAQSILYTYGKEYFKEKEMALKLTSAFGAGISYRGEMCGAVSGALMVIGLIYGYTDPKMDFSKEMTYLITQEFIKEFEKINGAIICSKLLNTNINTTEGIEYARANKVFDNICPKLINSSSHILEHLMKKYPVSKIKQS